MTSSDVRQTFLDYFASHGHEIVRSGSLVPADDPTLLFTNAGMNQFKDLFLGRERRSYSRATTSQKCMRVSGKHNDLDNVGPSWRHHTLFEMLGNFSFGDYFKAEAIPFAWTLLTEVWQIPPDRLYPTVFKGEGGIPRDDEAHAIWRDLVSADRIVEMGLEENFWAMGDTGPCGRCSEIHYHRGAHLPCSAPTCLGIDCSCDRYVEIWNNVFMEFERDADGNRTPLPAASIDTGMGLERIVAVLQGTLSNYDTDLFTPLLKALGERTGRVYGPLSAEGAAAVHDTSMRVVTDHLRAMTFLIADGVMPSNEWRGYVLRKIMRRAMRHGKKLGASGPFLHELVEVLVQHMGHAYPELPAGQDAIVQVVRAEEDRFDAVLDDGLPRLEAVLAEVPEGGHLPGADVFRLYDTYGLPVDFIEDLAGERSLAVDLAGFNAAMEQQRAQSRATASFGTGAADGFTFTDDTRAGEVTSLGDQFDGYAATQVNTSIVALFDSDKTAVDQLDAFGEGYAVLARTPFYLESGGQVSDTGLIRTDQGGLAHVEAMERVAPGGPRAHRIRLDAGELKRGDSVTAEVDTGRRDAIRRNHTATHLLHAALRDELGPHVKQAGSLVASDRLRFDFAHGTAVTREQLDAIEREVNRQVHRNHPVETAERSLDEAIADGAMALFGEKYTERVRVVSVPGVSMELCGGPHCQATGAIGLFTLTQESGVAAGVRRIEAVTGTGAIQELQRQRSTLDAILGALGVHGDHALSAVERLIGETRRLAEELERQKMQAALGGAGGETNDDSEVMGDARFVARRVSGLEKGSLRGLADSLRDRLGQGVVVLASENGDKVALVVSVSKDLVDRVHAGQVVKAIAPIVDGGGGGRPDFAQAGGRRPEKINELLAESRAVVQGMLSA